MINQLKEVPRHTFASFYGGAGGIPMRSIRQRTLPIYRPRSILYIKFTRAAIEWGPDGWLKKVDRYTAPIAVTNYVN